MHRCRRSADRWRLARRAQGLRTAQDDLQPLHSLEPTGVFNRLFAALAAKGGKPDQLMIDATHLKEHRTAASLLKKGLSPDVSGGPKAA
jgi:transposase